jgi:hypothetical protein
MADLRQAAQQALAALEDAKTLLNSKYSTTIMWFADEITALKAALAQQAEPDAYGYASRLAVAIWEKHYKDTAPQWKPLDDLMGVLTQIDNMTSGLRCGAEPVADPFNCPKCGRHDFGLHGSCPACDAQQAEPVQEPVDADAAYQMWLEDTHAPALRRMDSRGAFSAGWQAAALPQQQAEPVQLDPNKIMSLADNYASAQSEMDGEHSVNWKYYVQSRNEARAALAAYLGIKEAK